MKCRAVLGLALAPVVETGSGDSHGAVPYTLQRVRGRGLQQSPGLRIPQRRRTAFVIIRRRPLHAIEGIAVSRFSRGTDASCHCHIHFTRRNSAPIWMNAPARRHSEALGTSSTDSGFSRCDTNRKKKAASWLRSLHQLRNESSLSNCGQRAFSAWLRDEKIR